MKNIYLVLMSALFLTACGGGGNDDTSGDNTPATSPSAVNAGIIGNWASENCIPTGDDTSEGRIVNFSTEDGIQLFIRARVDFATSNCNGDATNVIYTGGEVSYTGTQIGSVCTADQFNSTIILATDNISGENTVSGAEMQLLLSQNQLSNEVYDITCLYNEQLFFGLQDGFLDTESSYGRPEEIDFSIPYDSFETSSRAGARGVQNINSSLNDAMNNVLQEVKKNL